MQHQIALEFKKETTNTVRYKTEPGVPPIVKTLYVEKWALPDPIPQTVFLIITDTPKDVAEE